LGGRLDATNVLHPLLTICTDISFDHVEILGRTIPKIAREKAGIIKPGVPHLIGPLPSLAVHVMETVCRRQKAPLIVPGDVHCALDRERFRIEFQSSNLDLRQLKPALLGVHQLRNASVALQAVSVLKSEGVKISKSAVVRGIEKTEWDGRFQILRRPGRGTVVVDVCHNAAGAAAFADTFRKVFAGRKAFFVFGVVKRKDHQAMFDAFKSITREYSLVPLKTKRSMPPRELMATVDFASVPVHRGGSLAAVWGRLLRKTGPDDIIVIAGSHYLAGEFLQKHGRDAGA
jgi:dihydrofolate synthase / folylpolyglutamate synthase